MARSRRKAGLRRASSAHGASPSEKVSRGVEEHEPKGPPLGVAGLFAGIGGLELGLELAGHSSRLLCDSDPLALSVLERHFDSVPVHVDVRTLRALPRDVELLVAGFPCQDLSQAGKARGIVGSQSRLVGEVFRLLERRRCPWVLVENVPFMLRLQKGRALGRIVSEFERLGYQWAYRVVDTLAFGLPQRRHRVFLLASRVGDPKGVLFTDDAGELRVPSAARKRSLGFYWTEGSRGLGAAVDAIPTLKGSSSVGIPSSPAILLPSGRVVTPHLCDAERLQGFPAEWTAEAGHQERDGYRWKLIGNAVSVPVAEWLGVRIRTPGRHDPARDIRLRRGSPWPAAAWGGAGHRYAAAVSRYPKRASGTPIHDFLRYEPRDLSARATAGFLNRLRPSRLARPPWFERRLERHLDRVSRE